MRYFDCLLLSAASFANSYAVVGCWSMLAQTVNLPPNLPKISHFKHS